MAGHIPDDNTDPAGIRFFGNKKIIIIAAGLIAVYAGAGNIQALKDVSIKISEGEIITLIGANGAGKSTTLMSICGIVPPRAGEIFFMGQAIQDLAPNDIVSLGICQVPEGRRIFRTRPFSTVFEAPNTRP